MVTIKYAQLGDFVKQNGIPTKSQKTHFFQQQTVNSPLHLNPQTPTLSDPNTRTPKEIQTPINTELTTAIFFKKQQKLIEKLNRMRHNSTW